MAVLSGLVLSGFVAGVTVTDRVVFALADVQAREPVGALPGAATVIVAVDTDVMPPRSPGPAFETRVCPDGTTRRNVRCGFLDVPESRSDPEGRRVRIAVSIRQARSSASSSDEPRRAVVVLSGGPGAPLLNEAAAYQTSRALGRGGADVIVLDQRGSGRSVPSLACEGLGLYEAPTDVQLERCAFRHLLQGIALDAYTTKESAADIEDLRRALGYDQFDLVGLSYGTRLALVVAQRYPATVRSLVLAGVYPPNAPVVRPALELARVVADLDEVCREQSGCRETYGELDALLIAAMDRAASEGQHAMVDALSSALFFEAYWVEGLVRLPRLLAAAADGDWHTVGDELPAFAATVASPPAVSPAELETVDSFGLRQSVICSDVSGDAAEDPAYGPIRARLEAAGLSDAYRDIIQAWEPRDHQYANSPRCRVWGVTVPTGAVGGAVRSDVPALLLSGRFDPTTPPRHAELAAVTLPGAHLVVAEHLSHGLILIDSCVDRIVAEFLGQPRPRPSTACLANARRTPIELR